MYAFSFAVAMCPGCTTFTRIPWGASSRLIISPSFLMAHFDDVYAEDVGWEKSAMTEPTTMMEPPFPPAIMCRAAALQQWWAERFGWEPSRSEARPPRIQRRRLR